MLASIMQKAILAGCWGQAAASLLFSVLCQMLSSLHLMATMCASSRMGRQAAARRTP